MAAEILVHKFYLNMHVNLERRTALKSQTRLNDLVRVFIVSLLFNVTAFLLGWYVFNDQGCVNGFFDENGICKDCTLYVDLNCRSCKDRFACDECASGYFANDRMCLACKDRFGENCKECTAGGCTVCNDEFFVSYGQCIDCRFITGCQDEACTQTGCKACEEGYYLDEGRCNSCSSAITGCVKCRSSDQCTECASDFLTINQGICKCREGVGKNQYTDQLTGACLCDEGYYMTSKGCQTCEYMIPGCEECSILNSQTGIPLYQAASFGEGLAFLQCDKCIYGRFVEQGGYNDPVKCTHCATKWEGCAYCGDRGNRCEKCYQTHLLEGRGNEPCLSCSNWLLNCLKCLNKETCSLKEPRSLLSEEWTDD